MNTVVISGADRNLGLELCREFLKHGWRVFGGKYFAELQYLNELQREYPEQLEILPLDVRSSESIAGAAKIIGQKAGKLDMLVHNAAAFGGRVPENCPDPLHYGDFEPPFCTNALGGIRLVHEFLPLMEHGMKRICFVSSEAGVVSVSHRTDISSYGMSKTALNMAARLMFNELRPEGYTFRLYHPGWVRSFRFESQKPGEKAGGKFDPNESAGPAVEQFLADRSWEDQLEIIDNEGAAWPF